VSIDEAQEIAASDEIPILALDQALDRLQTIDRALATIVELRAFGGLTIDEAAHVLAVSPWTAKREWRTAKAWLTRELGWRGSEPAAARDASSSVGRRSGDS
jgi:DNA-directed RNA polymerase specialized sigma24 family protein